MTKILEENCDDNYLFPLLCGMMSWFGKLLVFVTMLVDEKLDDICLFGRRY